MAVSSMTLPRRRRPPGPFYTTLRLERGRALIGAHGEIDLTTHGALGEAALSVLDRPLIEEVFLDLGSVAFSGRLTVVAAEQGPPTSIARRDQGHLHER